MHLVRQWRFSIRRESTSVEEQWAHYLGLCGSWKGKWQRYTVDAQGVLMEKEHFHALCTPTPSADRQSVHHKNSYPAEALPKGREARQREDGLFEVDYGIITKLSFQQPFGPQSTALYGPGCAVIAPAMLSKGSPIAAVELVSALRGQRRRLVAMWRTGGESAAIATLQSVTTVVEVANDSHTPETPGGTDASSSMSLACNEDGWYQLHNGIQALLPHRLSLGQIGNAEIGFCWQHAHQDGPSGLSACFSGGMLSEVKATE